MKLMTNAELDALVDKAEQQAMLHFNNAIEELRSLAKVLHDAQGVLRAEKARMLMINKIRESADIEEGFRQMEEREVA